MSSAQRHRARGFTLVEVLIALLVVALGIGALLTTLASSANAIGRLRDKSFAQWIALNQISMLRLSGQRPSEGITTGELEYAGTQWRWRQEVIDQDVAGILRVEVRVAPQLAGAATQGTSEEGSFPATGIAFAFIGSSVMRASGIDPDWSLDAAAQRTGGPGGGAPGGGAAGGEGAPQEPRQ